MTSFVVRMTLAGCVVLAFNPQASGDLVVRITGTPGSGQSTWMFSGSAVAGSGYGFFDDNGNLGSADTWQNIGDYTTVDDFDLPESTIFSGSATLTINSATRNIAFAYIDHDSGGDDFGVGVDGNGNFHWTAGDTVSWTGSIVTNIDLNDLDESGLPVTFSASHFGDCEGTLDLVIQIDATAAPEPSSLLTALIGLGAIGFTHRRARKNRNRLAASQSRGVSSGRSEGE